MCVNRTCSRVCPRVYVGGAAAAGGARPPWVTHVLNVASEVAASPVGTGFFAKHGVADDDPAEDVSRVLDEGVDFVRSAGGTVLVHCRYGKSRSACVAVAYMCAHLGHTPASALAAVRAARPEVDAGNPFPAYLAQTEAWLSARQARQSARQARQ